jgi:hypothetical protein
MKKQAAKAPTKSVQVRISKDEMKWRAEDDMRTLLRAEEIRADKARLSKASAVAKQQMAAVAKVAKGKA